MNTVTTPNPTEIGAVKKIGKAIVTDNLDFIIQQVADAEIAYLTVEDILQEAKKLGLRGLRSEELPRLGIVLKDHWLSLIPLLILIYMILSGKTPDFAAVYGIIACVVVGFLINLIEGEGLTRTIIFGGVVVISAFDDLGV